MAKYQITRACGHIETVGIIGHHAGRERRAQYESTKLCYECYKAEQAKRRAAESQAAAEMAQSYGLPPLIGSPRQVAWAETIRAAAVQPLEALRAEIKIESEKAASEDFRKAADIALGIIDATLARTSASDWIDSRAIIYDSDWLLDSLDRLDRGLKSNPQPAPTTTCEVA